MCFLYKTLDKPVKKSFHHRMPIKKCFVNYGTIFWLVGIILRCVSLDAAAQQANMASAFLE